MHGGIRHFGMVPIAIVSAGALRDTLAARMQNLQKRVTLQSHGRKRRFPACTRREAFVFSGSVACRRPC